MSNSNRRVCAVLSSQVVVGEEAKLVAVVVLVVVVVLVDVGLLLQLNSSLLLVVPLPRPLLPLLVGAPRGRLLLCLQATPQCPSMSPLLVGMLPLFVGMLLQSAVPFLLVVAPALLLSAKLVTGTAARPDHAALRSSLASLMPLVRDPLALAGAVPLKDSAMRSTSVSVDSTPTRLQTRACH